MSALGLHLPKRAAWHRICTRCPWPGSSTAGSDSPALTYCAALALQSIEDVEDTRDGATMHLQELSALIDQVRANIEAIHGATPKP